MSAPDDSCRLGRALRRGSASQIDGASEDRDAIAAATHNNITISMYRSLARVRQQARWGTLKARTITPERMARLQEQHAGIVAALRDRDQAQAHTLLRKHLLQVREYMFGE